MDEEEIIKINSRLQRRYASGTKSTAFSALKLQNETNRQKNN